jgi:hypothetical protein
MTMGLTTFYRKDIIYHQNALFGPSFKITVSGLGGKIWYLRII